MSHNTRKRKKKKRKKPFRQIFFIFHSNTKTRYLQITHSNPHFPFNPTTISTLLKTIIKNATQHRRREKRGREGGKKKSRRERKKKKRTIESERISQLPSMSLTPHAWSICRKTSRPYKYPLQRIIFSSPHRTREICLFSRTVEINSTIVSTREGEEGSFYTG